MPEKFNEGASLIINKCHVSINVIGDSEDIVSEVLDDCLAAIDDLTRPGIGNT